MKGEQAEYIISFGKVFNQPRAVRMTKALNSIRSFVKKHTRNENTVITKDVNEYMWKNSKNVPRKIPVILRKSGDKIIVYLQGSKQLEEDKKREAEIKTRKEKAKEKAEEKKEMTAAEKQAEAEKERLKEEKKIKEQAAEVTGIKRK